MVEEVYSFAPVLTIDFAYSIQTVQPIQVEAADFQDCSKSRKQSHHVALFNLNEVLCSYLASETSKHLLKATQNVCSTQLTQAS